MVSFIDLNLNSEACNRWLSSKSDKWFSEKRLNEIFEICLELTDIMKVSQLYGRG